MLPGTVALDFTCLDRKFGPISDAVLIHLSSLICTKAMIVLENYVEVPNGMPEDRSGFLVKTTIP